MVVVLVVHAVIVCLCVGCLLFVVCCLFVIVDGFWMLFVVCCLFVVVSCLLS